MMRPGYDFLERMDAAREVAAHRRHRGLMTGACATGWERKLSDHGPAPERGSFAELMARTVAHWQGTCTDALEQFRFDVNGGWEGFI